MNTQHCPQTGTGLQHHLFKTSALSSFGKHPEQLKIKIADFSPRYEGKG